MAVDKTIMNVVNDPKRQASHRSNCNGQHPFVESPKCPTTGFPTITKDRDEADRKQTAGTPPNVDSTAGLDAPILRGSARPAGYVSSLSKTSNPRRKA